MSMQTILFKYPRADVLLITRGRRLYTAQLVFHAAFCVLWYGGLWLIRGDLLLRPANMFDWAFLLAPIPGLLFGLPRLKLALAGDIFCFDRTGDLISRNRKPIAPLSSLRSVEVTERTLSGRNRLSFLIDADNRIVIDSDGSEFEEYLLAGSELAKFANVKLVRCDASSERAVPERNEPPRADSLRTAQPGRPHAPNKAVIIAAVLVALALSGETIFVALAFVSAALAIAAYWLKARRREAECKLWPTTTGRVTSATVETTRFPGFRGPYFGMGRATRYYTPRVEYSYTVDRQIYKGKGIVFGAHSLTDHTTAEKALSEYALNSPVNVYYNPAHHDDSVLNPKVETGGFVALTIFLAVLATLIIGIRYG